jgi:ribonuclease E
MSGSMESSASWDREVSEDAAADPFASGGDGAVSLLTRMSDDDELEEVDADLDEGEDGLLDDPEAADDEEDALVDGDDELDGDLDDDDDDDLDDELIDLDDEYDVDDDEDKPHPGSRFDE